MPDRQASNEPHAQTLCFGFVRFVRECNKGWKTMASIIECLYHSGHMTQCFTYADYTICSAQLSVWIAFKIG